MKIPETYWSRQKIIKVIRKRVREYGDDVDSSWGPRERSALNEMITRSALRVASYEKLNREYINELCCAVDPNIQFNYLGKRCF